MDPRKRMVQLVGRAWDQARRPLYRNAIFLMLTSVIGNGLGFFFWVVVTSRYAVSDIGAAIALFSTLNFIGALGTLSQGAGLIRYLPEIDDKPAIVNTAGTVTALVSLGLSGVFLAVGIPVLLPELSFVLRDPLYILTIIACTVALGLAPILDTAAIAMRRADFQTWRITIFAILKIPFAILIASVLAGRAGVFLSLTLAFGVSLVVVGFAFLPRALSGYIPRPQLQFGTLRPILAFSLGNYAAGVISAAAGSLPLPLIYVALGANAGPPNAAYFYVASIVASLLYIIPGAVFTSFYAEASHTDTDRRTAERKAMLLSVGLLLPAIAGMWVASETVLRLFGGGNPAYARQAITPLRILTLASVPVFLNAILGTRVRIRKQTRPLIVAAAITAAITLGLGYVLLQRPDLGINGLAYATVLGQAAATPYLYFVAREAFEAIPTEPVLAPPLE